MKSVASIYPTPFDLQIRHEYNSSIFLKVKYIATKKVRLQQSKMMAHLYFQKNLLWF